MPDLGQNATSPSELVTMTDREIEHLRGLVAHRPDDELRIVLHPKRCDLCRDLAEKWLGWSAPLDEDES